jgi:hypothetical protein
MGLKRTGLGVISMAAVLTGMLASPAIAAPGRVGSPAALAVPAHTGARAVAAATPNCSEDGDSWCLWTKVNAGGTEFGPNHGSDNNLGTIGLRNSDGSVENEAEPYAVYLRLYYSPNYAGAWVCLDAATYIANTANYIFNNGTNRPGYHATLYDNVASVSFNSSACTNPIG